MWMNKKQVNGWWKANKEPTEDDKKRKHSLSSDTRVFLQNNSMHCYRWLVEPNQSGWELLVLYFCVYSGDNNINVFMINV